MSGRVAAWTAGAIALLACLRAVMAYDPMPGFGLDPFVVPAAPGAFGPAQAAILDTLTLTLAALTLALDPPQRPRRWLAWAALLAGVGGLGLYHGMPDGPRPHDLTPALAWSSAIAGAGAVAHAARRERTRRVVAALVIGVGALLASKALVQLLVEHRATIDHYTADPQRALAAQGIDPASPSARAFERRLFQPETTGWFGFSNVLASFLAAACAALVAVAADAIKRGRYAAAAAGALIGSACLSLVLGSASKGGIAVAAFGLLAVAAAWRAPARWRSPLARAMAAVAVAGPLAAVLVRGLVGERIGELSLLFRWFYIQAATRIGLANPLGVGPGGFKDAYALAKNPISPENAASPHSPIFDAFATLGPAVGLAVAALLVLAARGAAAGVLGAHETRARTKSDPNAPPRPPLLLLVAGPAAVVALGARAELASAGATPAMALVWIAGLVGWVVLARLVWAAGSHGVAVACGAGAIVLIAHGQIELTPTHVSSAALWAVWLAVAAARHDPQPESDTRVPRWRSAAAWATPGVLAAATAVWVAPTLVSWQAALERASHTASQPARIAAELRAARDPLAARRAAERLGQALGRRVGPSAAGEALNELARSSAQQAARAIDRAVEAAPADGPTLRAAARVWTRVASQDQPGAAERALRLAERATRASPPSAASWSLLASVHRSLGGSGANARALEALERAIGLNPSSPQVRYRAFELAQLVGETARARRHAEGALAAHERMRLDPLGAGLSDGQLAALRAFVEEMG